jgi:HK97 family phage portal protein
LPQRKAGDPLSLLRDIYGGSASSSGVTVNYQTALQCSVALACARVIAEGMSQVPCRLMRSDGTTHEAAFDDPRFALLDSAPSEFQTAPEFFDQIGMHLVLAGNAYVWKNRVRGRVAELLPFEPRHVTVERNGWTLTYKITPEDGASYTLSADEVWHVRGPSWNGYAGLDGVHLAREAIGLSLAAEKHGSSTFRNGARPSGILTTDQTLTADQRTQLRESWQSSQGGSENAGRVAVMSNGMKFTAMSGSNVEAQFLEARAFQVEEVCRAFRVMPIMVGHSDKAATYASAEQMFLAHVVHTMGPWYRRVEKSASAALLTPQEREAGLGYKFFPNALMRGASQARADFYTKLFAVGALSPNEIRGFEDLNPYEGGDERRVPMNMESPDSDGDGDGDESRDEPAQ